MRYIWSAFQPITRNVVTERAKQKKDNTSQIYLYGRYFIQKNAWN